jgi:hypothetical protein
LLVLEGRFHLRKLGERFFRVDTGLLQFLDLGGEFFEQHLDFRVRFLIVELFQFFEFILHAESLVGDDAVLDDRGLGLLRRRGNEAEHNGGERECEAPVPRPGCADRRDLNWINRGDM